VPSEGNVDALVPRRPPLISAVGKHSSDDLAETGQLATWSVGHGQRPGRAEGAIMPAWLAVIGPTSCLPAGLPDANAMGWCGGVVAVPEQR
jgi:hypothetical protein